MPSVTAYYEIKFFGLTFLSGFEDIVICKWESNGVEYNDTHVAATSSCVQIGYSNILWSTASFPWFTNNDRSMINNYIISSSCGR